jgi:outer membrane lipoprotein carrier protein
MFPEFQMFILEQRMKTLRVTKIAFFATATALMLKISSGSGFAAPQKSALDRMQEKYKTIGSLTAEFSQKKTNLALGTAKDSNGRIYVKRPNKFRWETIEPEPSILVSNGRKIWYYTPPFRKGEKGQVMVRRSTDQSQLAVDLLAGRANVKKDFKSKELGPDHFELIPVKPMADVDRVEVFIEKATNLVYKLSLFTSTGNQTELMLKNVTLDPKLSESMFNFSPPENTEEIR